MFIARALPGLLGAKGKDIERTDSLETPPLKTGEWDGHIGPNGTAILRLRWNKILIAHTVAISCRHRRTRGYRGETRSCYDRKNHPKQMFKLIRTFTSLFGRQTRVIRKLRELEMCLCRFRLVYNGLKGFLTHDPIGLSLVCFNLFKLYR